MDTVAQYESSDEKEKEPIESNETFSDDCKQFGTLNEKPDPDGTSDFQHTKGAADRLLAFSPVPNTTKTNSEEYENKYSQGNCRLTHKTSRRNESSSEKARTAREDIQEMKRSESQEFSLTIEEKLRTIAGEKNTRSRSKSSDRSFLFRKRGRKIRNYRRSDNSRRSPSPLVTNIKEKSTEKGSRLKYPKSWSDFSRDAWSLDKLKSKFPLKAASEYFDITKHLLFKSPPTIIKPFYYRNENNEEILVPYNYVRKTLATPSLPYNVNFFNVKEQFLARQQILDLTNKNLRPILEKFWNNNVKTKFRRNEPIGQRNWYPKVWKDSESKAVENSIGLSFLQNYSEDDEEDEEFLYSLPPMPSKNKDTSAKGKEKFETEHKNKKCKPEVDKNEEIIPKKDEIDKKAIDARYKMKDISPVKLKSPERNKNHVVRKDENYRNVSDGSERKMRNKTESESLNDEMSWTPERIYENPDKLITEIVEKTPKVSSSNQTPETTSNFKEKGAAPQIKTDDEWDESPKQKLEKTLPEDVEKKKTKKKKVNKKRTPSESSSGDGKKKTKKKKRKLERKRKLKEKEKAKKKKEKLKAEKLRLKREKKRKQKEKERKTEKEILKKLKKEIELSLEEVEREERENVLKEPVVKEPVKEPILMEPVLVKVEKEDTFAPESQVEDLRNFLDKKVGKVRDLREIVDSKKKGEKSQSKSIEPERDANVDAAKKKKTAKDAKEKVDKKSSRWEPFKDDFDILPKSPGTGDDCTMETFEFQGVEFAPKIKELSVTKVDEPVKPIVQEKTKEPILVQEPPPEPKSMGETTPDTDEYHSNWESDDGISPIVKKTDSSWRSDEENFKESLARKNLGKGFDGESPRSVHAKKSSKREAGRRDTRSSRTKSKIRSPNYVNVDNEIKLLAEERKNLSKERMRLEIERIRIHELERKKSMEEIEYISEEVFAPSWKENSSQKKQSRWDLREDHVDSSTPKDPKGKSFKSTMEKGMENTSASSFQSGSSVFSIPSSPEITSTKSPTPTVLESAYQEFMKAVSVGDDSKDFLVISSTDSESVESFKTKRKKVKSTRSERDRKLDNKAKSPDDSMEHLIVGTTDPKVLQEILLPGELPEIVVPAPVPSPKVGMGAILPPTVVAPALLTPEPILGNTEEPSDLPVQKKPFSFSALVLTNKKPTLLEKSSWKVEEDSEEELSLKVAKEDSKLEPQAPEPAVDGEIEEPKMNIDLIEMKSEETQEVKKEELKVEEKKSEKDFKEEEKKDRKQETVDRRKDERAKRRHSRSPPSVSRDKRRKEDYDGRRDEGGKRRDSSNRPREEESRRRDDDAKRRGKRPLSPRHRDSSPRRRRISSPTHRRSSPRRSPSRRKSDRRSPPRPSPLRRRRSPTPTKHIPQRRRSPSPKSPRHYHHTRRSKSPGHSPMDGLKKSVADSTISDDLLPQPYLGESSNSPLSSSAPASTSRRSRIALSPKRPSLDERINQVLGIETAPPSSWKPEMQRDFQHHPNLVYPAYQSIDIPVSAPTPMSKVLQVGNILQVVPAEEVVLPPAPPPPAPPPPAPKAQRIVQVGNMIQVVPTEMENILAPPPPPPDEKPVEKTLPVPPITPEKKSAESILTEERAAERDKKRKEKEDRRKEKERKRKEKDKRRKLKIKVSTEEMIKRALEMDGLIENELQDFHKLVPEIVSDTPGLDPSKSILSTSIRRCLDDVSRIERRKSVQFADGVRPGEGTSPSGGEELSSPPPQRDDLLKPKKFRKTEASKKKKRKIKVKVIKKRPHTPDSDEEFENLPPPSPPPGSPPPHIFPARVKVHTINNIPQHYLPTFGITTASQQPPPHINMSMGYQTTPPAVYRTPPPPTSSHVNVIGQHYPRTSHTQAVVPSPQLMHPLSQHVHPHGTPVSHNQQYGSF